MTSKQIIQIIKEAKEAERKNGYNSDSFLLGYLVSQLLANASDIKRLKKYDYMMGFKKAQRLFDEYLEIKYDEQH